MMSATTTTAMFATANINNNNNNNNNHINANHKNAVAYFNYASAFRQQQKDGDNAAATTTRTTKHLIKSNSYSGISDCSATAALEAGTDSQTAGCSQPYAKSHADSLVALTGALDMLAKTPPTTPANSHYNSPAHTCAANNTPNADVECTEYDAFLINANASGSSGGGGAAGGAGSARRSPRSYASKARASCCLRAHAFISRNWYLSYLVPISILGALMFVAYLMRDYAKELLFWIELQNPWIIFAIYLVLFTVVSFPIVVGYFVLLVTAGYLFGCLKGWFTVILGANLGIAIAHWTMRSLRHRIPMQKLIKNETARAILRVISGPRAFKVVLFTRLTPIPFGLQNAIFGISTIKLRDYHMATFLGLLPAQTINVYLGSTLRSMQEVLNDEDTKLTGYISFVFEVICGIALMFWVVQKARKELSETLLTDITNEGKHIDIQV